MRRTKPLPTCRPIARTPSGPWLPIPIAPLVTNGNVVETRDLVFYDPFNHQATIAVDGSAGGNPADAHAVRGRRPDALPERVQRRR